MLKGKCDWCKKESNLLIEIKEYICGRGVIIKHICPKCAAAFEALYEDEEEG